VNPSNDDEGGVVVPLRPAVPAPREVADQAAADQAAEDRAVATGAEMEPEPEVYDAEIVDEPVGWRPPRVERRPVLPQWVADPATRRAAAVWYGGQAAHAGRYHGLRVPAYLLRLAAQAPRGMARWLRAWAAWVSDAEGRPLRRGSVTGADAAAYLRLVEVRNARVRLRAWLSGAAALALLVAVLVGSALAPWAVRAALALLVVAAGVAGRRPGAPVLGQAVTRTGPVVITDRIVFRALTAAGLGGQPAKVRKGRDGAEVREDSVVGTPTLAELVARDGRGTRVVVDLPYGRTAADAIAKREAIASGLDVNAVQLTIERTTSSDRRIELWVADSDPYAGKPNVSPLARCPQVSVWQPQRLGVDVRGREVRVPLIFNGFVIGAVPRQGKTFLARNLIAPAVLDPYCDVTVLGAKSSDWEDAEQVAVSYCAGEGDDATVEYSVTALRGLLVECQQRYDQIRALPREQRPEGKITPELQARGFRPHVIVVEEAQNILGHRDMDGKKSKLAKEALYLCTALAKVGPAAGYVLVLATQRPSTEVVPSDLRDVLSIRIALKVNDRVSSDTILGDYRSARGIESATLVNGLHAGVATLVGVDNGRGGDHVRIRSDLLTAEAFGRVCAIGRQRRIDAGTLRGHAAGEVDQVAQQVSIVADVLAVWPGTEAKVQAVVLVERLAQHRPELYSGWDQAALTGALKAHKVPAVQVFRDGSNRNGYELAKLRDAATRSLEP
jgi:S-DNA-T family DNA segregation ATPase FtsK/SpoIIIE